MNKKYQVTYYNGWGNRIVMYTGTLEECQEWYESHPKKCDILDAQIEEFYQDPGREFPEL